MSTTLKPYHGFNHNSTLLGSYDSKEDAELDCREYRVATGNAAYISPSGELDEYELEQALRHAERTK
jgi:hypothetical protein